MTFDPPLTWQEKQRIREAVERTQRYPPQRGSYLRALCGRHEKAPWLRDLVFTAIFNLLRWLFPQSMRHVAMTYEGWRLTWMWRNAERVLTENDIDPSRCDEEPT